MIKPFELTCVILCGGRSSRMGEDKALLPFEHSNSLSAYQYNKLKPYFKKTYLSSKIDKFDFLEDKTSLLLDNNEIYSPIIALNSIFEKLKEDKIFIITVDTPLVSMESINEIVQNSKEYEITVGETLKTHNLCGVFSSSIRETTNTMIKEDIHKVGYLLKKSNTKIVKLANDEEFINLNDKSEYNKALDIINNTYN